MLDPTETNITLSMTRRVHSAGDAQMNGIAEHESTFVGLGQDFTMTFNIRDVVEVNISELSIPDVVKTQNGKHSHNVKSSLYIEQVDVFAETLLARVCCLIHPLGKLYLLSHSLIHFLRNNLRI